MQVADNVERNQKLSNGKRRQSSESLSSSSSSSSSSFDSIFSSEDASSSMPSPPDGGYGWVIVFAAFMINLISDGISFSFGILYTELLDYFGESKSLTSWVGSLFYGTCLIGGPLASACATKFGCRKVLMVGGVVASAGTFLSSFAGSIGMLCALFGVVTGLAMSMGYVSSVVMVAFYFEDKRALATGLAVCGSGIGTFVFAPLTEYLIQVYGWRGTMMIWSGIILNLVVCGALLRPLEFTLQERRLRALQKFERISRTVSYSGASIACRNLSRQPSEGLSETDSAEAFEEDLLELCHSQIQIPTYVKEKNIPVPIEILKEGKKNPKVLKDYIKHYCDESHAEDFETADVSNEIAKNDTVVTLQNNGHLEVNLASKEMKNGSAKPSGSCLKKSTDSPGKLHLKQKKQVRMSTYLPLYRKGLFFRGNLARFTGAAGQVRSTSCPELSGRRFDDSDSESDCDDEWDFVWQYLHFSKHMKRVLKTLFDPSILKHPLYLLFALSNFILYFWYDVPYIFVADRAIEFGMEESKASFLISVLGIVNTFGQIFYGFIGDLEVNLSLLYGFSLMACGLSVLLVPFFSTFVPLAILSGLFGLFISVNYSLSTVILVEFLGLSKLSNAYGLTMLVQGVANLVGPPVAAVFYDTTHSYDVTFCLGGAFIILSGLLLLCVPVCRRCCHHLQIEEKTRISTTFNASNKITLEIEEKLPNTGATMQCSTLLVENNETSV